MHTEIFCFHRMPRTLAELEEIVIHHCGLEPLNNLITFLEGKPFNLIGLEQPDGFLTDMVILACWKLIDGRGYQTILKDLELPFPLNHKSYQENCHRIWTLGENWAEEQIQWGRQRDWQHVAANVVRPGRLMNVTLWINSFDLPRQNPTGYSKKDAWFSYKLNKYGNRYMAIQDGHTRIRWLSGGYTPKTYDSDYIRSMRKHLKKPLGGTTLIGDSHFSTAAHGYTNVTFMTRIPKPATGKRSRSGRGVPCLSRASQQYNEDHRCLRNRVEEPFGIVKTIFPALANPWAEDEVLLDSVVYLAVAFHNLKNC